MPRRRDKILTLACGLLLGLGAALPATHAKPRKKPIDGRVQITFDYRDGSATPGINPFYYLNTGMRIDHKYFSFEVDTIMLVVLVDVVSSLLKWAGGGDDSILLMDGLNGNVEPGYYQFFHIAARYNAVRAKPSWLGVGLSTQLSHIDTTFQGERVPVSPFDLGVAVEARKQFGSNATLGVGGVVGNGWTDYSGFNPYYSAVAWVNLKFGRLAGGFMRATWKRQRLDFRGYNRTNPPVDPSIIRRKYWVALWSFDAGVSLSF